MFYILLLINCVLYTLKIMFEFQLNISKVTNITEVINTTLMFILIIAKLVEIILKSNLNINFEDDSKFLDLSIFLDLERINTISVGSCCFFFPFRILMYLAHVEYFSPAKTIMNTITRTAPGVIVYSILSIIIMLGWGCCFYFSLNPLLAEF